jgi:uncharacterized protein YecE (DUF72 family)
VPDGFVFSLKGPRYAVNCRVLAEAGDSINRFVGSGITELGNKLGPLLWQFAPHKKFDESDFGKFPELPPKKLDGRALRYVVEFRSDTLKTPAFIALLRKFTIPVVYAEHDSYAEIADIAGDFVYARLQKCNEKLKAGYPPEALDGWAARAKIWIKGRQPSGLPRVDKTPASKIPPNFFIFSSTKPSFARRPLPWR